MLTCKHCGLEFQPTRDRKTYCSHKCYRDYQAAHPEQYRKNTEGNVACEWCGKMVYRKLSEHRRRVFCSRICSNQAQSKALQAQANLRTAQGVPVTCKLCGKVVYVKPHRASKQKYCSKACAATARFGNPFKHDKRDITGANNPNYEGKPSRHGSRQVAMRHYAPVCMVCGWDVSVDIHHITPVRHGGTNDPANLAVLCPNHHRMAELRLITQDELREMTRSLLMRGSPTLMQLVPVTHGS